MKDTRPVRTPLYRLSKIIPVPMRSTYGTDEGDESASWWQWRDRIFLHRRHRLA